MKTLFERLLNYYSLTKEEYDKSLKESEKDLPNFSVFPQINEVVDFFKECIAKNTKMIVYGDYDCDGIMSTSIIVTLFKKVNYQIGYYIPSREDDGYGLTIDNINKFHALGYKVILCVDNGISLFKEVEYASSLGIDIIIFDHHTIQEKVPNAKFILHPSLSNIGEYNISAGAVSFYFSWAFLGYIDRYLLSLASISTISDMMVLKSYNKLLVKLGLKYVNEDKFPSIYNLIDKKYETISEDNFALEIAPKVNSIGRLINGNTRFNIVKYFVNDDELNIKRLLWINETNKKRKSYINECSANLEINYDDHSIITIIEHSEGLAGLVANSLLNKYNKPVVVFSTTKNEDILKGSARSKNGFSIVKAFDELKDILLTYGGHECAGGLSIKKEDFYKFYNEFDKLALNHKFIDDNKKTLLLTLQELNIEDYNLYRSFGPFGEGNNKPLFEIKNFPVASFIKSNDDKHLFSQFNKSSKLVYFNYNHDILSYRFVNIKGELTRNTFNGFTYVQFLIRDFNAK